MPGPKKKTKFQGPYNIWAITWNGKCMHIHYATRLPRRKKKFAARIFQMLGDEAQELVLTSPNIQTIMEGYWDDYEKFDL